MCVCIECINCKEETAVRREKLSRSLELNLLRVEDQGGEMMERSGGEQRNKRCGSCAAQVETAGGVLDFCSGNGRSDSC